MHEVIECRRILQWTYVLGFYMQPGPEKQLFEFLQQNLEKNAEHLHGLVERPLDVAAAVIHNHTHTHVHTFTRAHARTHAHEHACAHAHPHT